MLPQRWSARATRGYVVGVALLTVLGFSLRHAALFTGFFADDFAQQGMLEGHYLVQRGPLDLFNFSDGTLADNTRLMHGGFFPWWSDPQLRVSMLRPLSSAMIWLDWRLFGHNALAHHLHTLLWWLLMLAAISVLFRRLLSPPVALLAYTFLVLDEAHGAPLAWIANRCVLVSTALGVTALLCYLRSREDGAKRGALTSLVVFSIAMGFGEYAACMAAYFVSYELIGAHGAFRKRILALWPIAIPAAAHALLRVVLAHGARYSGMYLDPIGEPGNFIAAVFQRIPAMFADLALCVRADFWTFGLPGSVPMVERGLLPVIWAWDPTPWRLVHFGLGLVAIVLVVACVALTPRSADTRNSRWLLVGSVGSLVPVIASFPSSRVLLVALIGFAPMLASFVVSGFDGLRSRLKTSPVSALLRLAVASSIGLYQLCVPAVLTYAEVQGLRSGAASVSSAVARMQVDERRLPQQRVVMLTGLDSGTSFYLPLTRLHQGRTAPRSCWTLSLTQAEHVLRRDGSKSFSLAPIGGFVMLATAVEQMYRTPAHPVRVGDVVDLGGARIVVQGLLRGQPKVIRAIFDVPLEDPSLLFLIPTSEGIKPFPMPKIGHAVLIPAPFIPP